MSPRTSIERPESAPATTQPLTPIAEATSSLQTRLPYAATVIRLAFGFLLIAHGLDKFDTGIDNVGGAFDGWGVPFPESSAWFVALFEVVGGVALVIGLATRVVAFVMSLILVGAIFFAKADLGLIGGWETDLAYIAGLLSLVFVGPGRFAVDSVVGIERRQPAHPAAERAIVG